ncbi:hypothetical protein BDR03DRAFT_941127, partial [Suillus americanus]
MTDIESWPLELSSFDSVRSFVDNLKRRNTQPMLLLPTVAYRRPSTRKTGRLRNYV